MRIMEVNVYGYDELDEEVKEKVRKGISESIVEYRFESLSDELEEILACDYDLHDCELQYSLGYCQGDGLSFNCKNLLESNYVIDSIKAKLDRYEKSMFTRLLNQGIIYKVISRNTNNHYCYASERDIELELDYGYWDLTSKQRQLIDKIEKLVVDIYLKICSKLEKIGYECYEVSEDDIVEEIKMNEYEFYENGRMV